MGIREIKYLLTIASCRSISAAADALYLSQPALSLFLKNYEENLGIQLFYRMPNGVFLTAAGERYLTYMRQIDDIYREAQHSMLEFAQKSIPAVELGLPSAKRALYLPKLLKAFNKQFLEMQIGLLEANSSELEQCLLDNTLQLALISLPLDHSELPHLSVGTEEVFLAVHTEKETVSQQIHIRESVRGRYVTPEEIQNVRLILLEKGSRMRKFTDTLFLGLDINSKEIYSVGNIKVALHLVAQGLGCTVVPFSQIEEDPNISYLSIGPKGAFRDTAIVYSSSFFGTQLCDEFTKEIISVLKGCHTGASVAGGYEESL